MGRGGVHGVGVVVGGGGCCAKMCMSKTTSHSYLAGKLVIRRLYLHGIFASFKFWPACDPFCSISDQRNPWVCRLLLLEETSHHLWIVDQIWSSAWLDARVWADPFETLHDKISDLKHYTNAKCGFLSQTTEQFTFCQQKRCGMLLTIENHGWLNLSDWIYQNYQRRISADRYLMEVHI